MSYRQTRNEITSISGTSICCQSLFRSLLIPIAADIELRNHELFNESTGWNFDIFVNSYI